MRRIERLYAISERLRRAAGGLVSAQELADEFEVTRRTIERDLASLHIAGAPIYATTGRNGGAGSLQRSSRTMVALDVTEIIGLIVAADCNRHGPFAMAATRGVDRLVDSLDRAHQSELTRLRECFRVAPATTGSSARVRSVIEDAVAAQRVVRIVFVDRNGLRTARSVEPVGFYQRGGTWSLVAWCRTRRAGRLFRLAQIERATATKETFQRRNLDHVLGWVPEPGRQP
jgi:predicted DNA-binding transcriptional regulator YafY